MDIGKLRDRITLQSQGMTQNEIGEMVPGWTDAFANVPASVYDGSGKEFIAAGAIQNTAVTRFTVRYMEGITNSMRVLFNATPYKIQAVLGQDRRQLVLMCVRGA